MNAKVAGRIGHMLEAARYVRSDLGNLDLAGFLADGKTQSRN